MNNAELIALVNRLRKEPRETEWLEFKKDRWEPHVIGEYLSALANSACVAGKPNGYLAFGIEDGTHKVVGTSFDPKQEKGKGNQDLPLWLATKLRPNVGFLIHEVDHSDGRVVIFEINRTWGRPVLFDGKAYIRIGTSKTELDKHEDRARGIWNSQSDWSAQVVEDATLKDLDPKAIKRAREEFAKKHPRQAGEAPKWDDETFLNKAKVTKQGGVTHAALLLLGRPESTGFLSPAVGRVSWILKGEKNRELDYEHFDPPFILRMDPLLKRIRNLTVRALPSGTLFPTEIFQYDPWVLREALHNSIAHQDYRLRGRVNVVETPSVIIISNLGGFLPGSVEKVIRQDSPLEIYRNQFLAEAMVNLNMIDTQGGGIKRMFQKQRERFFPMPDYDLSESDRVKVIIPGKIVDEHYTRMLMDRAELDLWQVMLLDRVQKRLPIERDAARALKRDGLVEGRYPNLIISEVVASATGQKARHIRMRGFDKKYYLDMIVELIRTHGPASRAEIDTLLLDKLPEVLTDVQKRNRVRNLLQELSKAGRIKNSGSRRAPSWVVLR
jgi:ATP-dependent DNA helicase RecG